MELIKAGDIDSLIRDYQTSDLKFTIEMLITALYYRHFDIAKLILASGLPCPIIAIYNIKHTFPEEIQFMIENNNKANLEDPKDITHIDYSHDQIIKTREFIVGEFDYTNLLKKKMVYLIAEPVIYNMDDGMIPVSIESAKTFVLNDMKLKYGLKIVKYTVSTSHWALNTQNNLCNEMKNYPVNNTKQMKDIIEMCEFAYINRHGVLCLGHYMPCLFYSYKIKFDSGFSVKFIDPKSHNEDNASDCKFIIYDTIKRKPIYRRDYYFVEININPHCCGKHFLLNANLDSTLNALEIFAKVVNDLEK